MTEKLPAVGEIFAMNLAERLRDSGATSAGELRDAIKAAVEQAQSDTARDCCSVKRTGQNELSFSIPADLLKLGRL